MTTVVITGSTRGIGFGMAEAFLKHGCNVVISGRSQAAVDAAIADLSQRYSPRNIAGQPGDVSDYDRVQALWDTAQTRFGRVDIWINNAAINSPIKPLWEQTPEQLAGVTATNYNGLVFGCKVAMQGMLKQGGGHIYNMEGLGSKGEYSDGNIPYGMSKYALDFLTKSLAKEARQTPVKVSALSPGIVTTDLLMQSIAPGREAQAQRIFNILADRVETVAPWLVAKILKNDRSGVRIAWLTPRKIAVRFMLAPVRKRQIIDTIPGAQAEPATLQDTGRAGSRA